MAYNNAECGQPGTDSYNLYCRYLTMKKRGMSDWPDFASFFEWATDNGYFKNAFLLRHDKEKPFGPDNAYWSGSPEQAEKCREKKERPLSPFCVQCKRVKYPERCGGCMDWENYFTQNWNAKIHREVPENLLTPEPLEEDPCEKCVRLSECDGVDEDCPRRDCV